MNNSQILVFDPFKSIYNEVLVSILNEKTQFQTVSCKSTNALKSHATLNPALIFVFLNEANAPDAVTFTNNSLSGFELIPKIGIINSLYKCQDCPIIHNKLWNFITIPFSEEVILHQIHKLLTPKEELNISSIKSTFKEQAKCRLLQGRSDSIFNIKSKIYQVASFNVSVLISGESGTGKELCARMIHFLSPRSEKPFVAVNCGAIPTELFENELFGHKKGAYTDANTTENGLISAANGGTLFLDEVETLPEFAQVKLLRFLEEKKYKPLGQSNYISSDVRVITAAKENLNELIQKNIFREDLFYRLDIVEIFLPPLRERKEDIPVLVSFFIDRYTNLHKRKILGIKNDALVKLLQYDWPGNIRELENVIQEAVVTNNDTWIDVDNLNLNKFNRSKSFMAEPFKSAKQKLIEDFEKSYLQKTLTIFNGNIKKAAIFAQKDRRAFYNLMKKYQIDPSIYRA